MFELERGTSKTGLQYIIGIEKLYKENKISREDYLAMLGAARIAFFGEKEEDVYKWFDEELEKGE